MYSVWGVIAMGHASRVECGCKRHCMHLHCGVSVRFPVWRFCCAHAVDIMQVLCASTIYICGAVHATVHCGRVLQLRSAAVLVLGAAL
jgi:hypothetical protein